MMTGFYNAIELMKYGGTLVLKERSLRIIDKNEILIKVHCSPINPIDLKFIKGQYGDIKPDIFPVIPGVEGSGEIVGVGENLSKDLIGKRVGVLANPNTKGLYDGLWAEYHYTTLNNVLVYDKPVPYENICFMINPLTSIGLLDTLKKNNLKSVLITGAAGNIGKFLIRLCIRESINIVCLVKNEEQVTFLKGLGAQNILRLNDPDCFAELKKLSFQLSVKTCFDCLGGDYSGKLLHYLPNDSTLYHFGNLEEKEMNKISSRDLIFANKHIRGWWLNNWLNSLTKDELAYWMGYIRTEILTNSGLFDTTVHETYDLEEVDLAVSDYYTDLSRGRIIINPFNENTFPI